MQFLTVCVYDACSFHVQTTVLFVSVQQYIAV